MMKTKEEIQEMLDGDINKVIASHRGKITIVDRIGDLVKVEMIGGCQGCAGARYTLSLIVTEAIKTFDNTVGSIEDVTDHSAGKTPFYPKDEPKEV
jgi:Fe-S cluster biogenesis protein NfuA